MGSKIDDIKFISQPIIKVEGGNVMKIFKASYNQEFEFKEAYFSSVDYNFIKGWKLQLKMTSNICVPIGKVKFTFVSEDFKSHKTYILGDDNYGFISVPPRVWYSFKGLSKNTSLILNITNEEHNEKYIKKIKVDKFPINLKL